MNQTLFRLASISGLTGTLNTTAFRIVFKVLLWVAVAVVSTVLVVVGTRLYLFLTNPPVS
jgi:hypothetical protein